MNVLCDFHHTDLFRSLRVLFEKRFGFHFFRPLGQDWQDRGYFFHPEESYGRGCLTQEPFHKGYLRDLPKGAPSHYPHGEDSREWSWITLEEAAGKIDLVVSTAPENRESFFRFHRDLRPQAKWIRYLGNEGEYPHSDDINLLCANLAVFEKVNKKNHSVFFHPEFDLALYRWSAPAQPLRPVIRTFLNGIYHDAAHSDPSLFWSHKQKLSQKADFYIHGLGTPPPGVELKKGQVLWKTIFGHYGDNYQMPDLSANDGEPADHEEISRLMRQTNIAWHAKGADGYGFLIHQLYASGRPVICRPADYKGKTAGLLLKDRKTCVMIEGNLEKDIRKIEFFLRPQENKKMCESARDIFKEHVNFDYEAKKIKKFIERLR